MELIRGKLDKKEAVEKLRRSLRSIRRYRQRYIEEGPESLKDKRKSNNRKLTDKDERRIIRCKLEGKHRSARFIRDMLKDLKKYQDVLRAEELGAFNLRTILRRIRRPSTSYEPCSQ